MSEVQEWAKKAENFQKQGKYNDAAKAYDKVVELAPEVAEVWLNRGVVLSAAGRDSEALKSFDKAIELKPDLASAHCNRANIYKSSGRSKEAAEGYREAVKHDPKMQTAHFGLAHVLNELDEYEEALKAANEAIKLAGKKVHPPSHNERVYALFKLGRSQEAIVDIDVLTKETPIDQMEKSARSLYALVLSQAAISASNSGNHEKALPYHQRAAEAEPSYQNLFNHAICLIQNEKLDESLVALEKAKQCDSKNWKVHAAIGTVLMQRKKYKEAGEAFVEASKFPEAENDETVNFNAGIALMNGGREEEAEEYLRRVLKVNRDNWTANALLGTVCIGKKDFQGAKNVLEVASGLSGGSTDSSVWYNLGYSQLMCNDATSALESFNKALELDPESKQAKAAVEALKSSPEEIKESIKKMDEEDRPDDKSMAQFDSVKDDPAARAKVLLSPQRPPYLRRKSMEGIVMGRVAELADKFNQFGVKKD